MKNEFQESQQEFVSASQIARIDTELWAATWMYCPNCGNPKLSKFAANRPVADFYCDGCGDQFELKSQSKKFGRKVADGAYSVKMKRLASNDAPNLMLLQYDRVNRIVENFFVVPKGFFVPSVVEERKPLKSTARRAGWIGSNILLDRIPEIGRISVIDSGKVRLRGAVLENWNKIRFINNKSLEARGWLVDVMECVDKIGRSKFTLEEVYNFENRLSENYPRNMNVRPKIRQQLQVLRDNGVIEFLGGGTYRRL